MHDAGVIADEMSGQGGQIHHVGQARALGKIHAVARGGRLHGIGQLAIGGTAEYPAGPAVVIQACGQLGEM